MKQNAKIYVAGHAGLVGSALIRTLKKNNFVNIVTKNFEDLDLRRQNEVEKFFEKEKPEYVFLAAAKVGGIHANNTYKAEFIYDNLMIATNVIHAAYKYGTKKLLNLGSSCIYPKLAPQPLKEEFLLTSPLEPTNEPYAIAKIAAIKLCQYYKEQYKTNFISVMPTNLYGPNDNFDLEDAHVLPTLIRKFHLATLLEKQNFETIKLDLANYSIGRKTINLKDNKTISDFLGTYGITKKTVTLWGTGKPYREFLYVDDLAQAVIFLMKNHTHLENIINIGTGNDIRIQDLGEMIQNITQFKGSIIFDTSKPDGTPKKLLDVSKIHNLGWQHKIQLKQGIQKLYDWYLSKELSSSIESNFLNSENKNEKCI